MNKQQKNMIYGLLIASVPLSAFSNAEQAQCGDPVPPMLSVSDFNGDGTVTKKDMHMIKDALHEKTYYAVFDRNGDGKLSHADKHLAYADIHKTSTDTDQRLAKMYQRFKHFQNISGFEKIQEMGFSPIGSALAFHGQHWSNSAGQFATGGLREADPFLAEGINVLSDGSDIPALYWGSGSVPLFADPSAEGGLSTLDWPSPTGVWNAMPVQAFAKSPPDFFPQTQEDRWHAHPGLCVTMQDLGSGPQWIVDQYTTNAQCQATPNLQKFEFNGQRVNLWGNFWMLHAWIFDLNPRGVFGNVDPCIEVNGASEDEINGGRDIPPFFQALKHQY